MPLNLDDRQPPFVSTGTLPASTVVGSLIEDAYDLFRSNTDGAVSNVYPKLAQVAPDQFGICVVGSTGAEHSIGDANTEFTIMSVSKPFVFALVCESLGPQEARSRLGVNGTGLPFNSIGALSRASDGRTNPMVNPGAIAAAALIEGATVDEQWRRLLAGLSNFAGRDLVLDEEMHQSAALSNNTNQEIALRLHEFGVITGDPADAVDVYTRQCCISVSARDLAVMGATLSNGGTNPLTHQRVVSPATCHYTLAVMATAGLYETSGDWLYDVGLPGKSGIGGGVITVAPGKGALATFAPLLDHAGNSVKGQLAAAFLSQELGMDLFASRTAQ